MRLCVFGDSSRREHAQVSKSVTAAEAAAQTEAEANRRNKAGLDSVLASLQAAKKVNVLDKSRSDWKDFKTSDTKVPALIQIPMSLAALFLRATSLEALPHTVQVLRNTYLSLTSHPFALYFLRTVGVSMFER